jgi:hypothetical protein
MCGQYAGFYALLTRSRVCFHCLELPPLAVRETDEWFDPDALHRRTLRIPTLDSIRGDYGLAEYEMESGLELTAIRDYASEEGWRRHNKDLREPSTLSKWQFQKSCKYMATVALPYYDTRTRQHDHGVCCAGCLLAVEKRLIDRGWAAYWAKRMVYSRAGFLKHFQECEHAQRLWKLSDGGKICPPEMPAEARQPALVPTESHDTEMASDEGDTS